MNMREWPIFRGKAIINFGIVVAIMIIVILTVLGLDKIRVQNEQFNCMKRAVSRNEILRSDDGLHLGKGTPLTKRIEQECMIDFSTAD